MYYFSYKPGLQFKDSTKPIDLYQGSQKIGTISKVYKNWVTHLLDTSILQKWFTSYEIRDHQNHVRFVSKENSSFFGRQQYLVTYIDSNGDEHSIQLKDMRKFNFSPIVEFKFNNEPYIVTRKERYGWTEFSRNGQFIAQWKKMNLTLPQEIEVQLVHDGYLDDIFLIIGVFHTFFYDPHKQ